MKILATGVFDIIHPGHILFLESARRLGDELYVIVSCDKTAERLKHRPVVPELQRLEVVSALKQVDKAIIGDDDDMFCKVMDIKPDIIALGFDQDIDEAWLKGELEKRGLKAKLIRLKEKKEGELMSTREIKKKVRSDGC
jgi:FAD synthetase